jgi:hypothetical protein
MHWSLVLIMPKEEKHNISSFPPPQKNKAQQVQGVATAANTCSILPFGNQTWLAGKCLKMVLFRDKINMGKSWKII